MRKIILIKLTALLYIITTLHLSALYFFWYWSIWWFDILVHFLGGVWIGGMALLIFFLGKSDTKLLKTSSAYILSVVAVLVIGVLWEVFEFSLDTFIIFQTNDISDTISDIGADIAGGVFASLYIVRKLKQAQIAQ